MGGPGAGGGAAASMCGRARTARPAGLAPAPGRHAGPAQVCLPRQSGRPRHIHAWTDSSQSGHVNSGCSARRPRQDAEPRPTPRRAGAPPRPPPAPLPRPTLRPAAARPLAPGTPRPSTGPLWALTTSWSLPVCSPPWTRQEGGGGCREQRKQGAPRFETTGNKGNVSEQTTHPGPGWPAPKGIT
jgi:hypothetical protein